MVSESKPTQHREGSFKLLDGVFDKKIFFEFQLLSQGKLCYVHAYSRFADSLPETLQERRERIVALGERFPKPNAPRTSISSLTNSNGTPNVSGSGTNRAARIRKRTDPHMCKCKNTPARAESAGCGVGQGGDDGDGGGGDTDNTTDKKKAFDKAFEVIYPLDTDLDEEIPIERCGHCSGHKPPPKDQKPAWRGSIGSWMYSAY
jgi:hypothetical protein